jgi:hypothetical protein
MVSTQAKRMVKSIQESMAAPITHNEGLPPSAADRANRIFDNPVNQSDCVEVDAIAPDARPGWQARVRAACSED